MAGRGNSACYHTLGSLRDTGGMGMGRFLIVAGIVLIAAGLLVTAGARLPVRFGHLPGDIYIHGKNSTFYFPVVTCLLLSVILSLVLWLIRR